MWHAYPRLDCLILLVIFVGGTAPEIAFSLGDGSFLATTWGMPLYVQVLGVVYCACGLLMLATVISAWLISLTIAVSVAQAQLSELSRRIKTYCPEKEKDAWESLVVDFAKHVCEEALPAVNRGWGFPLSAWTLVATVVALASIVLAPGLGGTRLAVHALIALVHVAICAMAAMMAVRINAKCSAVTSALNTKRLRHLSPERPVILKRTTNLLETLTASGHFGARVLGVRITNRLLAKGFAGLLGLYTLMQSLGMGGEERA